MGWACVASRQPGCVTGNGLHLAKSMELLFCLGLIDDNKSCASFSETSQKEEERLTHEVEENETRH